MERVLVSRLSGGGDARVQVYVLCWTRWQQGYLCTLQTRAPSAAEVSGVGPGSFVSLTWGGLVVTIRFFDLVVPWSSLCRESMSPPTASNKKNTKYIYKHKYSGFPPTGEVSYPTTPPHGCLATLSIDWLVASLIRGIRLGRFEPLVAKRDEKTYLEREKTKTKLFRTRVEINERGSAKPNISTATSPTKTSTRQRTKNHKVYLKQKEIKRRIQIH